MKQIRLLGQVITVLILATKCNFVCTRANLAFIIIYFVWRCLGVTPAERLTNLYKTRWQHNVDLVFHELAY